MNNRMLETEEKEEGFVNFKDNQWCKAKFIDFEVYNYEGLVPEIEPVFEILNAELVNGEIISGIYMDRPLRNIEGDKDLIEFVDAIGLDVETGYLADYMGTELEVLVKLGKERPEGGNYHGIRGVRKLR